MAVNMAAVSIGNRSRFFTDDDHDTVRLFRHADSRAMACPQFRGEAPVTGKRQKAACRHDAVVADNDGAVMERCIYDKNISKKLF